MSQSSPHPDSSMETNETERTRLAIADAIAKRAISSPPDDDEERRFAMERDTRQEFRRLLDPGIARGVSAVTLDGTLKMLSTIAENLLKDPENEKFQRFKPTNSLIKKHLVDVRGALEYAIALGFRAEVSNFQPYYAFLATPKNFSNLRIGAAVLREAIERNSQKLEQAKLNKVDPKAVQREIALKVKLAYEDDRKEKKRRDELEKQVRDARAAAAAKKASALSTSKSPRKRPSAHNEANMHPEGEDEDEDDYHEDGGDSDEVMSILPVQSRMILRGGRALADSSTSRPEVEDDTKESSAQ